MCEVVLAKSQSQNLEIHNMARFFQHRRILPKFKLWLLRAIFIFYFYFIKSIFFTYQNLCMTLKISLGFSLICHHHEKLCKIAMT